MDRVTHRLPPEHVEEIDALVDAGVYPNRSEFVRAAVRQLLYDCPKIEDDVARIDPVATSRLQARGGDD